MRYSDVMREFSKRRKQILRRFKKGETKAAIAKDLGITRERVRQIVKQAMNE